MLDVLHYLDSIEEDKLLFPHDVHVDDEHDAPATASFGFIGIVELAEAKASELCRRVGAIDF